VGRASSRKKVARASSRPLKPEEVGFAANRRGGKVPATLAGYAIAVTTNGTRGLAEALIARANRRWDSLYRSQPLLSREAAPWLSAVPAIDLTLRRTQADFHYDVDSEVGGDDLVRQWPTQLVMSVDSAVEVVRFLLAGQVVGAGIMVRSLLERWTANLAFTRGMARAPSEPYSTYLDRVWDVYGLHGIGDAYSQLSETLHGRGGLLPAMQWEAEMLMEPTPPGDIMFGPVTRALDAVLRQLRGAVATIAQERGWDADWRRQQSWPIVTGVELRSARHAFSLFPLTIENAREWEPRLASSARAYDNGLADLPPRPTEDAVARLSLLAFLERRHRAASRARSAFDAEIAYLGDDFNPRALEGRDQRYVLVSEMAALLARWEEDPRPAAALNTASAAVRSGFWMWLEDRDQSLVCTRVILESTARARVWRLKPGRAERVEARGSAARLSDWAEEAGWRRLAALLQGLGEFAHFSHRSKFADARQLLSDLQMPDEAGEDPSLTTRGNLLDRVVYLLAIEVRARLSDLSPNIAAAFGSLVALDDPDEEARETERWFGRVWAHKGRELVHGGMVGPAVPRVVPKSPDDGAQGLPE
jgi:hypothetical protein